MLIRPLSGHRRRGLIDLFGGQAARKFSKFSLTCAQNAFPG